MSPITTIDEYIASCPTSVQPILNNIRQTIRSSAPKATELISYRMPAFRLNGILIYFAAFKHHIGLYPPIKGDITLMIRLKPYIGPKGNMKFPLNEPIPYSLISRIVKLRVKQDKEKVLLRKKNNNRHRLTSGSS